MSVVSICYHFEKKNYHQENNHSCNDAFFPENNLLVSLLNTFHSLLINLSYHREGPFLRSGSIFDFITGISVCNWMFPSVSQSLHWGFLTLSSVGYKNAPPRNQRRLLSLNSILTLYRHVAVEFLQHFFGLVWRTQSLMISSFKLYSPYLFTARIFVSKLLC